MSLARALATSNNQCFAQLAVHAIGAAPLLAAIERFGWLEPPAPAHVSGEADPGRGAVRHRSSRQWSRRVRGSRRCTRSSWRRRSWRASSWRRAGWSVWWPPTVESSSFLRAPAPRRVLAPQLVTELRRMLIDTTRSGTARRAFRDKRGRPVLGDVRVAGKTGSLSGKNPDGRYEWFIGVAPADDPKIAVATVLVQDHLWWRNASQVAADVLARRVLRGQALRSPTMRPASFKRRSSAPPIAVKVRGRSRARSGSSAGRSASARRSSSASSGEIARCRLVVSSGSTHAIVELGFRRFGRVVPPRCTSIRQIAFARDRDGSRARFARGVQHVARSCAAPAVSSVRRPASDSCHRALPSRARANRAASARRRASRPAHRRCGRAVPQDGRT